MRRAASRHDERRSSGAPAALGASGSLRVADDALHVQAHDLPPGGFGYCVMSATQGALPLAASAATFEN